MPTLSTFRVILKSQLHGVSRHRYPQERTPYERARPPTNLVAPVSSGNKDDFSSSRHFLRRTGSYIRRKKPDTGATLDVIQVGLKVSRSIAGLVPVPMLVVSLQVAATIVEVAQTIRSNKADCCELARGVKGYIEIISRFEEEDMTEGDLYALQELQDQLEATLHILLDIAEKSLFRQICHHQRNKSRIVGCRQDLTCAFKRFMFRNQLSLSVTQERAAVAVQAVPRRVAQIMAPFFLT